MFSISAVGRRASTKLLAGTAVFALAATAVGVTAPAFAAPAPPVQAFIETPQLTGNPANAISAGWWGHEGAGRSGVSMFSLDASPATLATQMAKIGPDATINNLHVAFVLTTADGSAEKPAVTAGQTVGQVFHWFDASSVGHSLAGNTSSSDYVDALSTEASYNAWYNAGQLVYGFDDNLVAHDATQPGNPASGAHAIGTSILNTWAAGTHVSLVYYVSTANNAQNEPIVTVGADGHAETAWMPFTTVAMPADHSRDPVGSSFPASYDTVRTSAGYSVAGAVAPAVGLNVTSTNGNGTLTASLTDATTHAALTNATGTVQFSARPVDAAGGTFTNVGSPVPVTAAGTASMPISGLTGGHYQEFQATYLPDSAASSSYTTATSGIKQVFGSATTLTVGGTLRLGYKQSFTAVVAATGATPTGTVTFLDRGVIIGSGNVTSGRAVLVKALALGWHSISARYNGATGINPSTSVAKSVTITKGIPTITPTLSPIASRITRGMRPKLTVSVRAYGLAPTGTLTILVTAPTRRITTLRVTLRYGVAAVYLPAVLHGTTKVTIKYPGSTTVAAGTKVISFYAR